MGKSTISMAIFNSYVKLPEGNLMILKLEKKVWTVRRSYGLADINMVDVI